jgi:chromate transporter
MKKESYLSKIFALFITFFQIGLFTFGGGYAMIPIIQKKVIEDKKWINNVELLDILAIAESTPGPIAVNSATFVGYKVAGVLGSIFATLGLAIPSFIIIFVISLFYEEFMKLNIIQNAFKGLKIGVILLLINATFKLKKSVKFNIVSWLTFIITTTAMVAFTIFNITIPSVSIIFIALGAIIGLVIEVLSRFIKKGENK